MAHSLLSCLGLARVHGSPLSRLGWPGHSAQLRMPTPSPFSRRCRGPTCHHRLLPEDDNAATVSPYPMPQPHHCLALAGVDKDPGHQQSPLKPLEPTRSSLPSTIRGHTAALSRSTVASPGAHFGSSSPPAELQIRSNYAQPP
jgi:hypothetical protein